VHCGPAVAAHAPHSLALSKGAISIIRVEAGALRSSMPSYDAAVIVVDDDTTVIAE
jgi:hypothetical protein